MTALLAVLVVLAVRPVAAEMHATTEFQSGATRPVTVALLPARVELVEQRMIRNKSDVEGAAELEGHLTTAVEAGLAGKGYEVQVVTTEAINADAELQALVVEANRRFDEVLANVSCACASDRDAQLSRGRHAHAVRKSSVSMRSLS
jgi:hypothetical protein